MLMKISKISNGRLLVHLGVDDLDPAHRAYALHIGAVLAIVVTWEELLHLAYAALGREGVEPAERGLVEVFLLIFVFAGNGHVHTGQCPSVSPHYRGFCLPAHGHRICHLPEPANARLSLGLFFRVTACLRPLTRGCFDHIRGNDLIKLLLTYTESVVSASYTFRTPCLL